MANTFTKSAAFGKALDMRLAIKSEAEILRDDFMVSEFRGNDKVTLTDATITGLGNYSSSAGYPVGAVTLTQTDYTLAMDRAHKFNVNRFDAEKTGVDNLMKQLGVIFVDEQVAPEIDAYVFSKTYSVAKSMTGQVIEKTDEDAIANNSYKLLNQLFTNCWSVVGFETELVAFVDFKVFTDLMSTTEITRRLQVENFKRGEMDTKVNVINGVKIIPVPDARMKTTYDFNSGETTFGFAKKSSAINIGALVLPRKRSVQLVKEQCYTKYFAPQDDQNGDNHQTLYHLHYDGLVRKSRKNTIFALTYGNKSTSPSNPSGT